MPTKGKTLRPPRGKVLRSDNRPSAHRRGYTSRWQKARKHYLLHHPLCVRCKADGRVVPATVVDHITPHRGDKALFWKSSNWQALCETCHNRKTATEDRKRPKSGAGGYSQI